MSGKAMAWSRGVKVGNARAKQVLRELCIAQNDETGFCSPSIKSLVELTEMTESTVLKALAHLREAGFIEVKKRKTPSGWANCYSFPALEGTLKTEGTINVNGTLKTEDTLKTEGTIKFEGEGTLKSEGRGTLKFEGVKKEEKNNKKFSFAHACDSAACPTVEDIPADVFGPDPDIGNPPADLSTVKEKPAKEKTASKKGSRFNLETLPDEWAQAAKAIRHDVDPAKVFDEFRDYWVARPGAGGCKLDWLCVWRNWLRRMRRDEVERMSAGASSDAQKAQPYFSAQPQPTSQRLQAGAWFRKKTAPAMAANAVEDAHEAEMYEVLRRETGLK